VPAGLTLKILYGYYIAFVLFGSQSKHYFLPYTSLTDWFL